MKADLLPVAAVEGKKTKREQNMNTLYLSLKHILAAQLFHKGFTMLFCLSLEHDLKASAVHLSYEELLSITEFTDMFVQPPASYSH